MINFPLSTVYLESVDSTNSYLKRIIKESGLTKGLAVMAKAQTAGRGRLGRTWLSSNDTLCMSVAVKNECAEGVTLLAALAVYEALKDFCPDKALQVKWPNDIICNNKKLSGILCERVDEYTVIGIGINVNDKSFDNEIAHKATSLYLLSGKEYEIKEVFKVIILAFESVFTKYNLSFSGEAKEQYESLCVNFGKTVTTEKFSGTALGISKDGSLIVDSEGALKNVSSGEVAVYGIY